MSERTTSNYVDRCIDFISTFRRRCLADLALMAVILGALSLASIGEPDGPKIDRLRNLDRAQFVEAQQRCNIEKVRSGRNSDRGPAQTVVRRCVNS